jgi:hypothetical protein
VLDNIERNLSISFGNSTLNSSSDPISSTTPSSR